MALTRIGNQAITLDANEIPSLPASKITSGTFADARIAASNVTQHSAPTDLQPIKSDISALALREATNESSAAFNLPNQHIDTFQTDTLGTKTNAFHSTGYLNTMTSETGLVFLMDGGENGSANTNNFYNLASGSAVNRNGVHDNGNAGNAGIVTSQYKFGSKSYYYDNTADGHDFRHTFNANSDWDFGTGDFSIDGFIRYSTATHEHSVMGVGNVTGNSSSTNGDYYIRVNEWNNDQLVFNVRNSAGNGHLNIPSGAGGMGPDTWFHICVARKSGSIKVFINGNSQTVTSSSNWSTMPVGNSSVELCWGTGRWAPVGMQGYIDGWRMYKGTAKYFDSNFTPPTTQPTSEVAHATGSVIQAANAVGSAKTKVGGTLLYKDQSGTNTLGTDLKVYFSCNGGSNWTEAASYNAITPVYSTGIKQVRLGETTCTSGTDIRYKIEWANQASGSKEGQVHGIGVNY